MSFVSMYGNQLFLSSIFTKDTANYPLPTTFSVALLTAIPDRNAPSSALSEVVTSVAGTSSISKATTFAGNLAGLIGGTYVTYTMSSPMSYAFADGQQVTVTNTNATFNLTGIVKNTVLTNTNTIAQWVSQPTAKTISAIVPSTPAAGSFRVTATGHGAVAGDTVTISSSPYAGTWIVDTYISSSQYTVASTTTGTFTSATSTVIPYPDSGNVAFDDIGNGKLYYVNLTGSNTTAHPASDQTNWLFLPFVNYSQFTIYIAPTLSASFSGSGGIAVGNTGYARQTISTGTDNWIAGQSSVYNKNALTWPAAFLDCGNVVGWALLDNQATPNVLASGGLQQNLLVKQNSVVILPAGSLRLFIN